MYQPAVAAVYYGTNKAKGGVRGVCRDDKTVIFEKENCRFLAEMFLVGINHRGNFSCEHKAGTCIGHP